MSKIIQRIFKDNSKDKSKIFQRINQRYFKNNSKDNQRYFKG